MSEKTVTVTETEEQSPKPNFRARFKRNAPETEATLDHLSIKTRAKNVAKVLGVVTLAGVVSAVVAKRTADSVEDYRDYDDTEVPTEN